MSFAQRERRALADTMADTGPDAPTLCGEWTVRDLAAHLVIRERRLDAMPGILIKPLAGHTARVQDSVAQQPFGQLVEQVRGGPPAWSPMKPLDAKLNITEMFVHHEDVRRGKPGWEPREFGASDTDTLWSTLNKVAKLAYRKSPVTVVLATPQGKRSTARRSDGAEVVLTGEPGELLLQALGRDEVRVEASGEPSAVQTVLALERGF